MGVPPPQLVASVRCVWQWQWQRLMDGLARADADGNFSRRPSQFSGSASLEPSPTRPLLIVGRSCPWAHRAWLVWSLRQLAGAIELVVVEPDPEAGRWVFTEPLLGCQALLDLYALSGASAQQRATVPVLLDAGLPAASGPGPAPRIICNESADLMPLLNRWPLPAGSTASPPDFAPPGLAAASHAWGERLQHAVNDGVYRCGFARNQAAYHRAESALFEVLEDLETSLTSDSRPWLCGDQITLADLRLFPTLIRWEQVYAPLFGCSRKPLWMFPALWAWRARLYGLPGVAATCFPDAWRRDYFGALFPLHPSGIVPAGPDLATLVSSSPFAPQP